MEINFKIDCQKYTHFYFRFKYRVLSNLIMFLQYISVKMFLSCYYVIVPQFSQFIIS